MNSDSINPEDPMAESTEQAEGSAEEDFSRSEVEAAGSVTKLLPAHAAPYSPNPGGTEAGGGKLLKMQRQRGRPRKVERMPTTSDLEYHALMTEERAKFIEEDPVLKAIRAKSDPMSVLAYVKEQVAVEQAALHFQRMENEKLGRDTAQVSTRRIDALKKIADIELELKKLGAGNIDAHSEKFQRVFNTFIESIREIAGETMSPQQCDLFFNRLSTALEGWEDRAADILR